MLLHAARAFAIKQLQYNIVYIYIYVLFKFMKTECIEYRILGVMINLVCQCTCRFQLHVLGLTNECTSANIERIYACKCCLDSLNCSYLYLYNKKNCSE